MACGSAGKNSHIRLAVSVVVVGLGQQVEEGSCLPLVLRRSLRVHLLELLEKRRVYLQAVHTVSVHCMLDFNANESDMTSRLAGLEGQ